MKVILKRSYSTDKVTLGMLQIQGIDHKPIFTLENPWKQNKRRVSRIPKGDYLCKTFSGKKYKNVYQVTKVKGRSAILFHHGNFVKNTNGCILVGLSAGELLGQPAVLQSRKAMNYLKSLIGEDDFYLTIRD